MASEPNTVIVEKSGSGGVMTALIALLIVALIAIGAYSIIQSNNNKNNAIAGAAEKVGDAAQDAGDAAKDATKSQ